MNATLSIIVPAYNEADNLKIVLGKLIELELPFDTEKQIIVVDDGSADATYASACEFVSSHPEADICLLRHEHNQGKGAAIRTALPHAMGDYVVIQDSDNELDPNDFIPMLTKMTNENLDVLYGSRFLAKEKVYLYRSFYYGTRVLSWLTNILYGQHITDESTCYKMFRTPLLKGLNLKCRGFEFCPEVTAKVARSGVKIYEIPVSYSPRSISQGKKVRAKDGLKAMYYLLKYRFVR